MELELALFEEVESSELDELQKEIDRHVDASFMGDVQAALARAREADAPERALA